MKHRISVTSQRQRKQFRSVSTPAARLKTSIYSKKYRALMTVSDHQWQQRRRDFLSTSTKIPVIKLEDVGTSHHDYGIKGLEKKKIFHDEEMKRLTKQAKQHPLHQEGIQNEIAKHKTQADYIEKEIRSSNAPKISKHFLHPKSMLDHKRPGVQVPGFKKDHEH